MKIQISEAEGGVSPFNGSSVGVFLYILSEKIGKVPVSTSFYPYIMAYFHKTFFAGLPLSATAYFLPIIIGIALVLLVFFIGKELFDILTGFYSALIFSFHPFFITWNYAGFADTHAINLFFSLIIIFSALKYFKTQKHAWGVLALVTLIVFFKTWKGAFYIIVVLCFIAAAITIIR